MHYLATAGCKENYCLRSLVSTLRKAPRRFRWYVCIRRAFPMSLLTSSPGNSVLHFLLVLGEYFLQVGTEYRIIPVASTGKAVSHYALFIYNEGGRQSNCFPFC